MSRRYGAMLAVATSAVEFYASLGRRAEAEAVCNRVRRALQSSSSSSSRRSSSVPLSS